MLASGRESGTGYPMLWRVGRLRLGWAPERWHKFPAPGFEYHPGEAMHDGMSWIASLVYTPFALLGRVITGRWPVVAYVIHPYDGNIRLRYTPPIPRAEADYLVRRWAAEIREYGEPQYPAKP